MLKKLLMFFLVCSLVLVFPVAAIAKTSIVKATPTPTPTATPVVSVDSFDLFWPMVAGKNMQSKVYFLKTLKEKVRGFLIFGSADKVDYDVFLGIKRMLEAEVLIKGNVGDLANKTLDSAISEFDKANSALVSAKSSGDIAQNIKDETNTRVANLKKFTAWLIVQYPTYKDKLQMVLDKLGTISL